MDPILSIGVAGILNAADRFTASAERTASGKGDLATEAVEQAQDKQAFSASLALVRAGDAMMKQLLDIKV